MTVNNKPKGKMSKQNKSPMVPNVKRPLRCNFTNTELLAIGKRRHQLAEERLHALIAKRQDLARHRLAMLGARLDGISPLATLGRGYAIVRTPSGEVIRRASQVNAGQTLITTLAEGALRVRVDEVDNR